MLGYKEWIQQRIWNIEENEGLSKDGKKNFNSLSENSEESHTNM